jgi:hypothetical protein
MSFQRAVLEPAEGRTWRYGDIMISSATAGLAGTVRSA